MSQETVATVTKAPPTVTERPVRRKPAEREAQPELAVRFFLAGKGSEGGSPLLGRELPNESEALIESLKTGVNFFAVIEYRAVPDLTGKTPRIQKRPVKSDE